MLNGLQSSNLAIWHSCQSPEGRDLELNRLCRDIVAVEGREGKQSMKHCQG